MGKFCSNCGNKIHEQAVICVKCGVPTNNNIAKPSKGKSTASLTLGIIGLCLGLSDSKNNHQQIPKQKPV